MLDSIDRYLHHLERLDGFRADAIKTVLAENKHRLTQLIAAELWGVYGSPSGQDEVFWHMAERIIASDNHFEWLTRGKK